MKKLILLTVVLTGLAGLALAQDIQYNFGL